MRRDVGDNRDKPSSFTKKAKSWSVRFSDSDAREDTPYLASVVYSVVYVHESQHDTISSNYESDDIASKWFATEAAAKKWIDKKMQEGFTSE